jgi:hypothetical protein
MTLKICVTKLFHQRLLVSYLVKICPHIRKSKLYYRVQKILIIGPVLSELNHVHNFIYYFCNLHFDISFIVFMVWCLDKHRENLYFYIHSKLAE